MTLFPLLCSSPRRLRLAAHVSFVLVAFASVAQAQGATEPPPRPPLRLLFSAPAEPPASTWLRAMQDRLHLQVDGTWGEDRNESLLDAVRRELTSGHLGGQPRTVVRFDILPVFGAAIRKVKEVRRKRATANARRRVASELAEFCRTNECDPAESSAHEGVFLPGANLPR